MSSDNPEGRVPEPIPDPPVPPRPVPPEQVIVIPRPPEDIWIHDDKPPPRRRSRSRLALVLFLLTCVSTFLVYACKHWGVESPLQLPILILALFKMSSRELHDWVEKGFVPGVTAGLIYSISVMSILGAHELGHYLQARRYGVPASLPFFIPFPISPFGTMGAVIVQQSGVADRKSMFDIAISGPLAGLVVALPLTYWGILNSDIKEIPPGFRGIIYGDPLLLKWMMTLLRGPMPEGHEMFMHPILFAGWVGIFITGLNLIPIGQLDGGHILYCLIGRHAHYVARGVFWLAAGTVAFSVLFGDGSYYTWSLMLFLIWMLGTRHPPTANDRVRLGPVRIVLGWLTLMFVFIGLTPMPIAVFEPAPKPRPAIRRNSQPEIQVQIAAPTGERPA
jgi:Zn-dependent protease